MRSRCGARPRVGLHRVFVSSVLVLALASGAAARENGITGRSIIGCDACHSGGTTPTVSISGPAAVTVGTTATYSLTVSGGAGVHCGLDVSASLGALVASDAGTRLLAGEIVHNFPPRSFAGGDCVYGFDWTAPDVSGSPTAALRAAGNSTNGDGGTGGDQAATTSFNVAVTGGATVTISATPSLVALGDLTSLQWSTANSSSCQAFGDWSGTKATGMNQSEDVMPLEGSSVYGLTCFGSIGNASAQAQTTVTAVGSFPSFPISTVALGGGASSRALSMGGGGFVYVDASIVPASVRGVVGNLIFSPPDVFIRRIDREGIETDLRQFSEENFVGSSLIASPGGKVYSLGSQMQGFSTLTHLYRTEPDGSFTQLSSTLLAQGLQPFSAGQFVVDANEDVYWAVLSYTSAARAGRTIQKVSPDGTAQVVIERGDGLELPAGIAVDDEGGLYVADEFLDHLLYRSPSDQISILVSASGDGNETLSNALDAAVDAFGNAYVAGSASDNVFRVTPEGEISVAISKTQIGSGVFNEPIALESDRHGNVYVLARASRTAWRIRPDGQRDFLIDSSGDGVTPLATPRNIAVDDAGNVYVSDDSTIFRISTGVEAILDATGDGVAALDAPTGLDTLGGDVFVAGTDSDNLFAVDSAGGVAEILSAAGGGAGPFSAPEGLGANRMGDVYAGNATTDALVRVMGVGSAQAVAAPGAPQERLARDGVGNLFYGVGRDLVRIDSMGGVTVTTLNSLDPSASIGRLAAAPDGALVLAVDPDVVRVAPGAMTTGVLFSEPAPGGIGGIAVDGEGVVYVADPATQSVVALDGGESTVIDASGDGFNTLDLPDDVAVDAQGNLFVVDVGSDRVFRVEPDGDIDVVLSATGDGVQAATGLYRVVVSATGTAYVSARGSDAVFAIRPLPEPGRWLQSVGALLALSLVRARTRSARCRRGPGSPSAPHSAPRRRV